MSGPTIYMIEETRDLPGLEYWEIVLFVMAVADSLDNLHQNVMSTTHKLHLDGRASGKSKSGLQQLLTARQTLLVLSIGLAAGSLLNLALSPTAFEQLALNPLQIQALPAGLLLWAAALFLA